jgi:uncharacterized protein (UPF0303 family)
VRFYSTDPKALSDDLGDRIRERVHVGLMKSHYHKPVPIDLQNVDMAVFVAVAEGVANANDCPLH